MIKKKLLALAAAALLLAPTAFALEWADPEGAPVPETNTAVLPAQSKPRASLSTHNVAVDGVPVSPEGYNIGGENYYKLRDLAYLLTGKATAFDVTWDQANQCIGLLTRTDYTVAGGEMQAGGQPLKTIAPSHARVLVDGVDAALTGYNINSGTNYYKLRDLAPVLGFEVAWDDVTSTVRINSLTPEEPPVGMIPDFDPNAPVYGGGDEQLPEDIDPETPEEPAEPVYPWIGPKIDGKITLLIDPGHGGKDIGAYHKATGQNENTTNLAVALYLKEMLEEEDVEVILSREDEDEDLYGTDRKNYTREVCEEGELDFVISIHHNSFNGKVRGTEVWVQQEGISDYLGLPEGEDYVDPAEASRALGQLIHDNFMDIDDEMISRGVKTNTGKYMVSTPGDYGIPSLLTEFCFIDNDEDLAYIDSDRGLKKEAKAIFEAIMAYFEDNEY